MKGLSRDRKKIDYKPIKCSRCHTSGGTLVKVSDHYEHQNQELCGVMQLRRER